MALVERARRVAFHHAERNCLADPCRALDQVLQQSGADAAPLEAPIDEELLQEDFAGGLGDLHPADVLRIEADDADLLRHELRIEARRLPRLVPGENELR